MPTSNPRITITLPPATHAQLRRLSELTDQSQSSLVSEILEASAPVFERTIRVLEAANDARAEMKGRMASDLATAQAKLEKQLGLQLDTFDEFTGHLLDEVEAVRRRARRGSAIGRADAPAAGKTGGATPLSNRGVRSTPKKGKKPTGTRR